MEDKKPIVTFSLIEEIVAKLKKESFTVEEDWICTDEDNNQYSRRVGRFEIEFKEDIIYPFEEDVETISDTLDLTKVDLEELIEDVSYYYEDLTHLYREELKEDVQQFLLIALECHWEQSHIEGKY